MIYFELILYLAVIFFLLSRKPVARLFSDFSIPVKVLLLSTLFLVLFAQIHKNSSDTYPFVHWGMYASAYPTSFFYEYNILLEDGTVTHYPFELMTFNSQRPFMRKLDNLVQKYKDELIRETLDSLTVIYQNEYPENHITKFELHWVTKRKDSMNKISETRETVLIHFVE